MTSPEEQFPLIDPLPADEDEERRRGDPHGRLRRLGDLVTAARLRDGRSVAALAAAAGVEPDTWRRLEEGWPTSFTTKQRAENALGWPHRSMSAFIAGGAEPVASVPPARGRQDAIVPHPRKPADGHTLTPNVTYAVYVWPSGLPGTPHASGLNRAAAQELARVACRPGTYTTVVRSDGQTVFRWDTHDTAALP